MKTDSPALSVVIPTYNSAPHLVLCLESLFSSNFPSFECIVINDNSSDETISIIKKYPARVISLVKKYGPAFARNRGAEKAKADIIVFLDSDVVVHEDTLAIIDNFFKRNPGIEAVFGSYDDKPGYQGVISQYKNLFHHFIHQNSQKTASTFWSGCGAIKKDIFLKLEGFREKYTNPLIEDIDLGIRLKNNGYRVELVKELQVRHLKKWSLINLIKTDIFFRGIPWVMLMIERRAIPNDLNLKWNARISTLLIYGAFIAVIFCNRAHWLPYAIIFILFSIFLLNIRFYRFFYKKRGILFTIFTFPMQILYYISCGVSVLLGGLCALFCGFYLKK